MIKTDMSTSTLLDSFDFDEEGKSIDKLMLPTLDGGFVPLIASQEHKNAYTIGTVVEKRNALDDDGNAIMGLIETYEVISCCYLIKYSNGLGPDWELVLEDDMAKRFVICLM